MPDDLRKQIIEAIAASGDENYKRLLMLLLRVEEIFLEKVSELSDQLTVPVKQHADDHEWISDRRKTETTVKTDAHKILVSVLEKAIYAGLGIMMAKHFL